MKVTDLSIIEMKVIAKERFLCLSREAKFIITLIFLGAVIEATELTLGEITHILRMCGWQWKTIRKAKREIRQYLKEG